MAKKPHICIVAHNAFGALAEARTGHIGGVEHQTSLLAKWLASEGYTVSFLTWDEPTDRRETVHGVRVIRLCRLDAGLPGLRFFYPRWSTLNRALQQANADIYYHNGAEAVTGQIGMWCKRRGRRFIFSAAADADVDQSLPTFKQWRDRWLYRMGLRNADRIIVQNRKQQTLLSRGFGLPSIILPLPCSELGSEYTPRNSPGERRILWVGRLNRVKRLEWFLDLAHTCPQLTFDIVGPIEDPAYAQPLLERANMLPNVVFHGRKSRPELLEFYRSAACLCCTSLREGFPNTFLEAWSQGVPVVSTLDIDRMIEQLGLGAVAPDVRGLQEAILKLVQHPHAWKQTSERARRYFEDQHAIKVAMPRFAACFTSLATGFPHNS
jgi:glycosyltransferase involved in cell wall biosynthesis